MRFLILSVCLSSLYSASITEARRPNLIVIFTDDHGWTDLGVQEILKDLKTPHIDEMASASFEKP